MMLNFRKAQPEDADILKKLTRSTLRGTISFAFLMSAGGDFYENFLCGEEDGIIKSVIFDTGDEYFLIFGEEFPELLKRCTKTVMVYEKSTCDTGTAQRLEGREIQEMYKLMSGRDRLSFDDERRYVLRLRAKNSGLCEVFGIKKGGELVACTAVSSVNEGYGLIADVFTKSQERNKGYGADCLMTAVNFILENEKIPMLLCEENMCKYYEKAGFTVYGKM